jgi:hypothetical protein
VYKILLLYVNIVLEMFNNRLFETLEESCSRFGLRRLWKTLESIHIQRGVGGVSECCPYACIHNMCVCAWATFIRVGSMCRPPLRIRKMCAREDFVRVQNHFF